MSQTTALSRAQLLRNRFEGRTGINAEEAWFEVFDHLTGTVHRSGNLQDNHQARRGMRAKIDELECRS